MQNYRFVKYLSLFISVSTCLAGCGGGGGNGSDTNSSPPPTGGTPDALFTDVTSASGIQFIHEIITPTQQVDPPSAALAAKIMAEKFGGGVAAGDIDNDDDIDLFFVRGDGGPNLLYRNDGNLQFTDITANSMGLAFTKSATETWRHSGPTFADMDGDGDLDLFIGGLTNAPSFIFQNNGDNTFTDVTADSPELVAMNSVNTVSAAFGDYDRDGDIDMFLAHWGTPRTVGNPGDTEHLWQNNSSNGKIIFNSVSESAGISPGIIVSSEVDVSKGVLGDNHDYTFTPTFADMNNDGYPDILIVADFKTTQLFYNNQDGTFTRVTDNFKEANGANVIKDVNGMGSAVADYDNDGDLDWFITGIFGEATQIGNRLYQNEGGVLKDVTGGHQLYDGGWGWGACIADFDGDSDLDIYHTNGWENNNLGNWENDSSRLFISDGGPDISDQFTESASVLGIQDTEQGRGVVCADFDNDGDTDVLVVHRNTNNSVSLYRNDLASQIWLTVKLVGNSPNTEALGARIFVTTGGVTQMREVHAGSNFTSQNPTTQIFGLGEYSQVDGIVVEWPDGSGSRTIEAEMANQHIVITQQP